MRRLLQQAILPIAVMLALVVPVARATPPDAKEIDRLIKQLTSKKETERARAEKRLQAIGIPALDALQKVADSNPDFDLRIVADRLIEAIVRSLELRCFEGQQQVGCCVAFSPDGKQGLSSGWDATVRLWDLETGQEVLQFTGHSETVWCVAFAPDGRRALSTSGTVLGETSPPPLDCTIRVWDVASGKELRRLEGHQRAVRGAVFSPDGRRVLSGGEDKTLRLWDLDSGKELRCFRGHTNQVLSVAMSPDGRLGLSGSGVEEKDGRAIIGKDNTARLWDLETGKELRRFEGHTNLCMSVAFSPEGRRILTGSWDETMRLWDAATGKELRRFEGHSDKVEKIAFAPDGRRALSAGWDHTVRLWDLASGRQLLCYKGHTEPVIGVALARDGRRALSTGVDRTVRLWKVPE